MLGNVMKYKGFKIEQEDNWFVILNGFSSVKVESLEKAKEFIDEKFKKKFKR